VSSDRPTLYSPALLGHARSPQHAGVLADASEVHRVDNPLCGDRVTLHLKVRAGRIVDVSHQTRGCALCLASASVMTAAVLHQSIEAVRARARTVVDGLQRAPGAMLDLGDPALALFGALGDAPGRVGCVALPWQALLK